MTDPLLAIDGLSIAFAGRDHAAPMPVLHGIDLTVEAGGCLGLVGESGSGKSLTALAIMGLLPRAARVTGGAIRFDGRDLRALTDRQMRDVRGHDVAMIYQEPMTALDPVVSIGQQVREVLSRHMGLDGRAGWARAVEILALVGIPDAAGRAAAYPHQLSGGLRQRAVIAMALACGPRLIIADEPTTALDVTVQAQIIDLLRRIRQETGAAVLLITHDLGIVSETADRVAIMYAGHVVEHGAAEAIFRQPQHPYTIGLIASVPDARAERRRLVGIPGSVPQPQDRIAGCPFHPRCPEKRPECETRMPPTREIAGRAVACWARTN